MMDRPQEQLLAFSGDCMKAVGQSYLPIVAKRHEQSFTDEHKAWQQLRRGRYVEFNLASPGFMKLRVWGLKSSVACMSCGPGSSCTIFCLMGLTSVFPVLPACYVGPEDWRQLCRQGCSLAGSFLGLSGPKLWGLVLPDCPAGS